MFIWFRFISGLLIDVALELPAVHEKSIGLIIDFLTKFDAVMTKVLNETLRAQIVILTILEQEVVFDLGTILGVAAELGFLNRCFESSFLALLLVLAPPVGAATSIDETQANHE